MTVGFGPAARMHRVATQVLRLECFNKASAVLSKAIPKITPGPTVEFEVREAFQRFALFYAGAGKASPTAWAMKNGPGNG